LLSAVGASAFTFLVNQLAALRKNSTPRIQYSSADSIPLKIDGGYFSAYSTAITNISRKKIEDIAIHLSTGYAQIKIEEILLPPGLTETHECDETSANIRLPYLKAKEEIHVKCSARSSIAVPTDIDIKITSPNDLSVSKVEDSNNAGISPSSILIFAMLSLSIIALFFTHALSRTSHADDLSDKREQQSYSNKIQAMATNISGIRDSVIADASVAHLPNIAEIYFNAENPHYYNEGDIAYALASSAKSRDEIVKYRKLGICLTQVSPTGCGFCVAFVLG
jgi:hypothetical protein